MISWEYISALWEAFGSVCGMKLLVLLILFVHHAHLLYFTIAQVTGFQSLDCGSKSSTGYKDTDSDILWMPDSYNNMILGGTSASVQAPSSPLYYASTTRYTTIRYFDSAEYSKFCYVLPNTTQGKFYLVRASFWLGAVPPYYPIVDKNMFQFNLLINADVWQKVVIQLPQSTPLVLEIYVQAISTSMAVCLSGKRTPFSDPPFISTLELRTLNEIMHFHEYTSYALRQVFRIDYGPQGGNLPVRYRNDSLDRIWSPLPPGTGLDYLSTNNTVDNSGILDSPPMQVLQTAIMGHSDLLLSCPLESGKHSYFYALYFSEIDPNVTGPGQRVFDIILNGNSASPIFPQCDIFNETGNLYRGLEVYGSATAISVGWLNFTLSPISTSIYPALVSALEIFESFDSPMSNGTSYPDLLSINNIIATLPNLGSYSGDPCLPSGYGYPWVTCSDITTPFPRVINISLSSQELAGEIPASLNNLGALVEILLDRNNLTGQIPNLSALTNLQVLNLSNNKLSGAIPDFLSKLPNLHYLYLQNNNLSGPIPVSLLERSKFIQFDYSGNDFLCTTTNSTCYDGSQSRATQHSGLKIGLAILGAFIFLGLLGTIMSIAYRRRRQKLQDRQSGTHNEENLESKHVIRHTEMVEASNLLNDLSYHEVESATNDFRFKLGEGAFGHVYEGKLVNGLHVAVKVLQRDSRQGAHQFLNEVNLLSRVHHKNLVKLLGYCTEQKLMLLYEYMTNGSLQDLLYGDQHALIGPFTWIARLRVLLDAAHGLEYLHCGCNPKIIHRDVKSSNILLNHKMEGKVADFGISRATSQNSSDFTMTVMGTFGYLDPEYSSTLRLTEKADVYSFGVLIFEVICGQPPFLPNTRSHILERVRPWIERGLVQDIVETTIRKDVNMSSLWKVVEIAMMCVEYDSSKRPTMSEVSLELNEAIRIDQFNSPRVSSQEFPSSFPLTKVNIR